MIVVMGGAFRVNRVGLNPLRKLEVRDFYGEFELFGFGRKSNVCIFGLKIFFYILPSVLPLWPNFTVSLGFFGKDFEFG